MKNQIKFLAIFLGLFALTFSSCEKEDTEDFVQETSSFVINDDKQSVGREKVTDQKILDQINQLELDSGIVTRGDFYLPDGSVDNRIYIGDDIVITEKELDALIAKGNSNGNRQYRTNNLVSEANQTINIVGINGGPFGLSHKGRVALQRAVENYNSIANMTLNFNLTFNRGSNGGDILVFDTSTVRSQTGGVAGFPTADGEAFGLIQIFNLERFSLGVNEHVLTHEIGHTIGFRHTDWFSRQSCGQNISEGTGSSGAIHVNGTPTGFDATSLMLACFNSSEDGNFNANDITALRNMYPERVPLYRYFRPGNHFYTTNFSELGNGGAGYNLEGIQAYVHKTNGPGRTPLYRYHSSSINNHFYTTNFSELGNGGSGYTYEGVQAFVYSSAGDGRVPLYRYYNRSARDHFYTTNFNELGNGGSGYTYEGIQAYVYRTP